MWKSRRGSAYQVIGDFRGCELRGGRTPFAESADRGESSQALYRDGSSSRHHWRGDFSWTDVANPSKQAATGIASCARLRVASKCCPDNETAARDLVTDRLKAAERMLDRM